MNATLEAVVVAAAGAILGGAVGSLLGPVFAVIFAVVAGVNGAFGGYRQIYHWRTWQGNVAFVLDSTWGMFGTFLGDILLVANLFWPGVEYRVDCSRRQNRHVFFGGAAVRPGYAFTQGNVISNADSGRGLTRPKFLERHEGLHIWQNRMFGPLYQIVYVLWLGLGALAGAIFWLFNRQEKLYSLVETGAYYDNPYEYWAYVNDHNWPHPTANPKFRWPRPVEQTEEHRKERQEDRGAPCVPPA